MLENTHKNIVWIEDNEMLIKKSAVGKILDSQYYFIAHCNGHYLNDYHIPFNKKNITYKCKYIDNFHVMLDGFVYNTSEEIITHNQDVWVSIYLKDLKMK